MASKKRLPKAVFEVGAVAVARIHLATGKPLEIAAQSIWSAYESQSDDPSAVDDLTSAAGRLIRWVQERALPAPSQLLRHLQHFCQAFEDDGRPKKRRLLDGLWFQKDDYNPQRVDAFIRKAQIFCASAAAGLMPLAPDNYQ